MKSPFQSYVAAGFSAMFINPMRAFAEVSTGDVFDADSGVVAASSMDYPSILAGNGSLPIIFVPLFFLAFFGIAGLGYYNLVKSIQEMPGGLR